MPAAHSRRRAQGFRFVVGQGERAGVVAFLEGIRAIGLAPGAQFEIDPHQAFGGGGC